jgi:uncharacterized protein YlzI (FlbEa/FlbD family)
MSTGYIFEDVAIVENNFSADSRDKDGVRIVLYEEKKAIKLHLAVAHIVQIEAVKDSKSNEARAIITLTSGNRYVTKRGAQQLCDQIAKLGASS